MMMTIIMVGMFFLMMKIIIITMIANILEPYDYGHLDKHDDHDDHDGDDGDDGEQVKWRTVAGTAVEGEDYEGAEGELVYTRFKSYLLLLSLLWSLSLLSLLLSSLSSSLSSSLARVPRGSSSTQGSNHLCCCCCCCRYRCCRYR